MINRLSAVRVGAYWCLFLTMLVGVPANGQSRKAPPGLFKDLDETSLRGVVVLHGKQLFIDDYLIEELRGARKQLNRPEKHPGNPILVKDRPWEETGPGYGSVIYDQEEKLFKMWYQFRRKVAGTTLKLLAYATSKDGIVWTKPVTDKAAGTNLLRPPAIPGFEAPGVFKDVAERDPSRRYKMLFCCKPDGTAKTLMTSAAFSPDGLNWTAASDTTALIPNSDTQACPFWDRRLQRYVAMMRFGPPNVRLISRSESEDFLHWSPKVTVMRRTKMDAAQQTVFYQMAPMPYADCYVGLVGAYHNESLKPVPPDKPWTDRQDLQLVFSRNSITWSRVGGHGTIPHEKLNETKDWHQEVRDATFLPYGQKDKRLGLGLHHALLYARTDCRERPYLPVLRRS